MRRAISSLLLSTVLLTPAAACTSSDPPPTTDPPVGDSSALRSDPADRAAIEAVVQGAYRAFRAAKADPSAPHPELREWFSNDQAAEARRRLDQLAAQNQRADVAANSRANLIVLSVRRDSASRYSVVTCELNDGVLVDRRSGSVVDDTTAIYRGLAFVERQGDGRWIIVRSEGHQVGNSGDPGWETECHR